MTMGILLTGFTLGAAGSLHCMGMCGPLSMALPVQGYSKKRRFFMLLTYQTGRVITYSILGIIFGLAGWGIYLTGHQQAFSITIGLCMLLSGILYFLRRSHRRFFFLSDFYNHLQHFIGKLLQSRPAGISFLLLGMANGLLPCGMVYMALAATLSFSELNESTAFMAMFGLGTLPAMMIVTYAGHLIKPTFRHKFRQAVPVFISLLGILLVLRGMNLGIPFISPEIPAYRGDTIICHPV